METGLCFSPHSWKLFGQPSGGTTCFTTLKVRLCQPPRLLISTSTITSQTSYCLTWLLPHRLRSLNKLHQRLNTQGFSKTSLCSQLSTSSPKGTITSSTHWEWELWISTQSTSITPLDSTSAITTWKLLSRDMPGSRMTTTQALRIGKEHSMITSTAKLSNWLTP